MERGSCAALVQTKTHPLYKGLMEAGEWTHLMILCILTGITEDELQEKKIWLILCNTTSIYLVLNFPTLLGQPQKFRKKVITVSSLSVPCACSCYPGGSKLFLRSIFTSLMFQTKSRVFRGEMLHARDCENTNFAICYIPFLSVYWICKYFFYYLKIVTRTITT